MIRKMFGISNGVISDSPNPNMSNCKVVWESTVMDHLSPLERGPLRGYWTEETGTTKSKSNEVVVRIQEKYRVAGPRLARPRLLLDHSQQDICIGKILLLRNSRLRVTKTHRFILPPADPETLCPIEITLFHSWSNGQSLIYCLGIR